MSWGVFLFEQLRLHLHHFLLHLQIALALVIRFHIVSELEIGLKFLSGVSQLTEFFTETNHWSDSSTLYRIWHLSWTELFGAWEFTVKWTSFSSVCWLLICIKHTISQGLRFIYQNIAIHIHRRVREKFLPSVIN